MSSISGKFSKEERLCSFKKINTLFEEGNVFYTSLFKIVWKINSDPQAFAVQAGFSVSKKGFRLAVVRNLIKRRMREAYRKNKHILYSHLVEKNLTISLFLILKGDSVPDYKSVEKSTKDALNKLINLIS